jgi:hypothetical protein
MQLPVGSAFQWAPSDTVSLDAALIKSNTFQAALSI